MRNIWFANGIGIGIFWAVAAWGLYLIHSPYAVSHPYWANSISRFCASITCLIPALVYYHRLTNEKINFKEMAHLMSPWLFVALVFWLVQGSPWVIAASNCGAHFLAFSIWNNMELRHQIEQCQNRFWANNFQAGEKTIYRGQIVHVVGALKRKVPFGHVPIKDSKGCFTTVPADELDRPVNSR